MRTDRRSSLAVGTVAAVVALAAAVGTAAAVESLWGDRGRPDPEVELRFLPTDADPDSLAARDVSGDAVPDDAFSTLDGRLVRFADYRGRPLVVNFFAGWCEPCERELPAFEEVHRALGGEVAFVGIAFNDQVASTESIVERTGVTFDVGRDANGKLAEAFGVTSIPATFFVSPEGEIVSAVRREIDAARLADEVERLR